MFSTCGISAQQRFSQTYTSSATFTVPAGVTRVDLSGHGQSGTYSTVQSASHPAIAVNYHDSGSVGSGSAEWGFDATMDSWTASLNDGSLTFQQITIEAYPDGSNTVTQDAAETIYAVPGSASWRAIGGWQSSGPITSSGSSNLDYQEVVSGQTGDAATGFGQTFPGGAPEGGVAPTTTFSNVVVTPGASYSMYIPDGAAITVTYFK